MDLNGIADQPVGEKEVKKKPRKQTTKEGRVKFIKNHHGVPKWFCPLWHVEQNGYTRACETRTQPDDGSIATHLTKFHRDLVPGAGKSAYASNMDNSHPITTCTSNEGCAGPWPNFFAYYAHYRTKHVSNCPQDVLKEALHSHAVANNDHTSIWHDYDGSKPQKASNTTSGKYPLEIIGVLDLIIEEVALYAGM